MGGKTLLNNGKMFNITLISHLLRDQDLHEWFLCWPEKAVFFPLPSLLFPLSCIGLNFLAMYKGEVATTIPVLWQAKYPTKDPPLLFLLPISLVFFTFKSKSSYLFSVSPLLFPFMQAHSSSLDLHFNNTDHTFIQTDHGKSSRSNSDCWVLWVSHWPPQTQPNSVQVPSSLLWGSKPLRWEFLDSKKQQVNR